MPGTRRGVRPSPNRCQAPGAVVPGTRRGVRPYASKQEPKSVPGTRRGVRPYASKQEPKSVPGTRRGGNAHHWPHLAFTDT